MSDNNYSLGQIKDYAASKVSKAIGYAVTFVAGYNLILDAVQKDADIGTAFNSFFVFAGITCALGLENKLMKRDKIAKEITNKTGY